ncbi:hypothetical protein ACFLT9_04150 [Acidobacteriota bacterium]
MRIKRAASIAIYSFLCFFSIRAAATIFPLIFTNRIWASLGLVFMLASSLGVFYFFLIFYKDYVKAGQDRLKTGGVLAAVGSGLVVFLWFDRVIDFVLPDFLSFIFQSSNLEQLILYFPLVGGIFIFFFFIILYRHYHTRSHALMKKAALLGLTGSSLILLQRSVVFIFQLGYKDLDWYSQFPLLIKAIGALLIVVGMASYLYFFISFRRYVTDSV